MKRLDLVRHLEQHGCRLYREGAKHSLYYNPVAQRTTTVPRHREIKDALARRVCRQLDIPDPLR